MLEFDEQLQAPCAAGNPGGTDVDPVTCEASPPTGSTVDERCIDPAFAAANPDLCSGFPRLILKPEFSIIESGTTVQYHTFLRSNGNEQEITHGLTYRITNPNIAVISSSGFATGSSKGETQVSVAWQNLSAFALLEVVNLCAEQSSQFLILIDNSKSSGVAFNSAYSSRLSYAKEAAKQFIDSINFTKDSAAVARFSNAGQIIQTLSTDPVVLKSAISGITVTTDKTNIEAGLIAARNFFNTTSDALKVIVLFSDGENKEGGDPKVIAAQFKESEGLIVVVALRAWGDSFDLLYRIASSGFFLSSYGATAADNIEVLKGLKTYMCSGDCAPASGTAPHAQLNYRGFINWDVVLGQVDLIGLGLWDLVPGNGLYLDLAGTFDPPSVIAPSPGKIQSKTSFSLVSGHNYRFKIDVAGDQRSLAGENQVRVTIISGDGLTTFLDQTVTVEWDDPFATSTFLFTASATASAKITVEMIDGGGSLTAVGPLVDVIIFEDLTSSTILLSDNFDNENVTETPATYSYYGCLDTPPGAQSADPTPPTVDVEQ